MIEQSKDTKLEYDKAVQIVDLMAAIAPNSFKVFKDFFCQNEHWYLKDQLWEFFTTTIVEADFAESKDERLGFIFAYNQLDNIIDLLFNFFQPAILENNKKKLP